MRELDYFTKLNQLPQQQEYLTQISLSRGYEDNTILNSYRAVYISSYEEMMSMLGSTSIQDKLHMRDGRTFVPGKLFIPGFTPMGHLVTYVSYDAIARFEAKESGRYGVPYYFYPEDSGTFRKSNFLLMPYESWQVALDTGRIAIADGVFDAGAVSTSVLPCAANLGTTLGKGVKRILSLFDEVTHFKDNDAAGTQLYLDLNRSLKKVHLVRIPAGEKDIDGYLIREGGQVLRKTVDLVGRPIL